MNDALAYFALFATAFGAATFLPIQSEIPLIAMAKLGSYSIILLGLVATVGNVLGALFNWYLGMNIHRFADAKWFPFKQTTLDKFTITYQKWGKWSLLLAWMPFIGDPLTLMAGIFKTPLKWFIPLVMLGKAGRYALILSFFYS